MLVLLVTGCSQGEEVAKLQTEELTLQTATADLTARLLLLEESQKKLAEVPDLAAVVQSSVEKLQTDWESFTAAYDAETASQVTENLNVISAAIQKLQELQVAADSRLNDIEGSRAKAAELLEFMAKHEMQAKDINQIGVLQTAQQDIKQTLDQLQSTIVLAQSDIQQTKLAADNAGRKALLAEQKARTAEQTARSAASKASIAMQRP